MVVFFMVVHYRLPGVVASGALIYYALVVYALFRLIPVTMTLAGVAGFVLSVGMAVDANILIFERTKEELRVGKSLPAAIEAGFNRAWNSILDSNVSSLITAMILFLFGSSTIRGFGLVLIIGVLVSMFTAITVTRTVLRIVVAQPWARKASLYGVTEEEFLARPDDRAAAARREARGACLTSSASASWFFAFSLADHDPGPDLHPAGGLITGGKVGLQFAIDFTGGTVWTIRFEDPNVTPGPGPGRPRRSRATRRTSPRPGRVHRDPHQGRRARRARCRAVAVAAPARRPARRRRPVGRRRARRRPRAGASPRSRVRLAGAIRHRRAVARRLGRRRRPAPARPAPRPRPVPRRRSARAPAPGAGGVLPTQGKLGELRVALEAELGPIAEQQSLSSVGAVVSSDLIIQALILILVRLDRDPALDHLPVPRLQDGRLARSSRCSTTCSWWSASSRSSARSFGLQIDSLFVTAMLTVIGFSVHDTIVVFDRIRENRARHAGEPFDRDRQPLDPADARPLDHDQPDRRDHAARRCCCSPATRSATFVLALLIGIISGTYCSIFNAAPAARRVAPLGGPAARRRRGSPKPPPAT